MEAEKTQTRNVASLYKAFGHMPYVPKSHELSYMVMSLALCINLMNTMRMGLSIIYFKGSQVLISKLLCISVPEDCFDLRKKV